MYLYMGFETLDLKLCELKLRELTARPIAGAPRLRRGGGSRGRRPQNIANLYFNVDMCLVQCRKPHARLIGAESGRLI